VIEVEHIARAFGRVNAVTDVSFTAADGQITGLLGPNGAGKTTTMRMLYSLLQPDRGSIRIDGIDPALDPLAARSSLGVLPDARGLYARLTARENIAYFAQLQGMGGEQLARRIEALVEELGLGDFIDRRTEGFSQGQRVRVALARALVHEPKTLLLDEPGNGLDVMSTRALRAQLRRLRDQGCCILLSTHIMQEVAALCDHIVIIADGRVAAAGSADELRTRSGCRELEDAFVSLIGSAEGLLS
jgi:sodium transport system ATP-binding protein